MIGVRSLSRTASIQLGSRRMLSTSSRMNAQSFSVTAAAVLVASAGAAAYIATNNADNLFGAATLDIKKV